MLIYHVCLYFVNPGFYVLLASCYQSVFDYVCLLWPAWDRCSSRFLLYLWVLGTFWRLFNLALFLFSDLQWILSIIVLWLTWIVYIVRVGIMAFGNFLYCKCKSIKLYFNKGFAKLIFRKILNLLFIASLTCEICGIYKTTNGINPGIILGRPTFWFNPAYCNLFPSLWMKCSVLRNYS